MGDYNNPNENNNQMNHSDPNQTPNGQPGYQPPQPEPPQYQSNNNNQQYNQDPSGASQNNQNSYQGNSYQNNPSQNNQYQNNPYQNNPYQYQQYQTPTQPQSNGMAVGALICGIIGFILSCCLWYIAIPLSIAGLVLGILVLKNKKGGKTLAIIGIILCAITIIIGVFAAIMLIAVASNPEFGNLYQNMLNDIQSSY